MPLSTLRLKPRGVNRKTQGQDGVRFLLSCKALSSSTTCRFIPAHPQVGFEPTTLRLTAERPLVASRCKQKACTFEMPVFLEIGGTLGVLPRDIRIFTVIARPGSS